MHPLLRPLYAGTARLATGLSPLASALIPDSTNKLVRTFRARRGVIERWETMAAQRRDTARPLIWMHAPSVGEGLQARPVAHALRARYPDWQMAYSWFSPSAEAFAPSIGADLGDYLPFDTREAAERLLTALQPSVIAFAKLDIWPTLVECAAARGIPVVLQSGTVAPGSGRRGALARAMLREAYRALTAVGAIDEANGERLVELGVRREVLHITGDTRFDQVWERAQRVDRASPLLQSLSDDRPTLVAGSTWPADETVLLPAWRALRAQLPSARLIIAPHEPTTSHLEPIITWARASGLRCLTLGDVERRLRDAEHTDEAPYVETADVVIVDRVGILGDLYALASAAFVGGGFHAAGLHSVIEPAAFGAPVLFGPQHRMSREAGLLIDRGGAASVDDEPSLRTMLHTWLNERQTRSAAGHAARALVESERGATARSVALIEALLPAGVGGE